MGSFTSKVFGLSLIELLVLTSLTVYRVVRFFLRDTLIDRQRNWLYEKILGDGAGKLREKLYELLDCKFCLSIWVSAGTVAVADRYTSVPLPVFVWLASSAGAMVVWRVVESDDDQG